MALHLFQFSHGSQVPTNSPGEREREGERTALIESKQHGASTMRTRATIWRCVRKGPLSAINLPSLVPNLLGGHCDRGLEVCIHAPGASTHFADTCSVSHIKHTSADGRPFAMDLYIIFLFFSFFFSHAVDRHFAANFAALSFQRISHVARNSRLDFSYGNERRRNCVRELHNGKAAFSCLRERSPIVRFSARFSVERDWNCDFSEEIKISV